MRQDHRRNRIVNPGAYQTALGQLYCLFSSKAVYCDHLFIVELFPQYRILLLLLLPPLCRRPYFLVYPGFDISSRLWWIGVVRLILSACPR